MSVGFGFSVGDFLAALRLVGTVIDALRESSNVSSDYRALLNELLHLETALIQVKRVELDESQNAEKVALRQAAAQCQRTIDEFWKKMLEYQPHLREGGSGSRVKDGWKKIKWALCKKDDLEKFRASLRGHTSSIEILLVTVQMNLTSIRARQQKQRNTTLAGKIQDLSCQWMSSLSMVTAHVAHSVQQGKLLLESSAKVLQMNLRVFQMVHDIQQFIFRLPPQVERQQPVYLIDAFGKESPFHLEFVRSAEALVAILKVNFKASGCGPAMIDRGEFAIRKAGMQIDVDLTADWDTCFLPGDRAMMSMIFKSQRPAASCPCCGSEIPGSTYEEIVCSTCGTTFQRVTELSQAMQPPFLPSLRLPSFREARERASQDHQPSPTVKAFTPTKSHKDDEASSVRKFRRVRLMNSKVRSNGCTLYEWENSGWAARGSGYAVLRSINGEFCIDIISEDAPVQPIFREKVQTILSRTNFLIRGMFILWANSANIPTVISFVEEKNCGDIWADIHSRRQRRISRTLRAPPTDILTCYDCGNAERVSSPFFMGRCRQCGHYFRAGWTRSYA